MVDSPIAKVVRSALKIPSLFSRPTQKNIELDFKPEVIGRLDSALDFHPLAESVMEELVKKQIGLLRKRLTEKKVEVKFSEEVITELASRGYDPTYGARPLNALFNKTVTRPLSRLLVQGNIENHGLVATLGERGEINFNKLS